MYQHWIKRLLDILLASLAAIVLLPLMLALMLAVRLSSPGPVLFTQKRLGAHKTYFKILKFRTMRVDAPHDMPTHCLNNPNQYITPVGFFLRRMSFDELPQIYNTLAGHMSLIGPRPALWNQYDLIEERDLYGANDIRPGLTGWAQINGRDKLNIHEKARLDGEYATHLCFKMDWLCFWGTVRHVIIGDGVVEGGTDALKKKERQHTSRR